MSEEGETFTLQQKKLLICAAFFTVCAILLFQTMNAENHDLQNRVANSEKQIEKLKILMEELFKRQASSSSASTGEWKKPTNWQYGFGFKKKKIQNTKKMYAFFISLFFYHQKMILFFKNFYRIFPLILFTLYTLFTRYITKNIIFSLILAYFISTLIVVCFYYRYKKIKKEKDFSFYKGGFLGFLAPLLSTVSVASKLVIGAVSTVGFGFVGMDYYCKTQELSAAELQRDALQKAVENTTELAKLKEYKQRLVDAELAMANVKSPMLQLINNLIDFRKESNAIKLKALQDQAEMVLVKFDQERVFADRLNLALIENDNTSIFLEDRRILQELQLQYGTKITISQNRNQLMRDLGKGALNRAIVYNLADCAFSYIENGVLKDFFKNDQGILELNDAAVGPGPGDQNQGLFFQNAPARPNIFARPIAQLPAPPVRPRIDDAPRLLQIEGRRQ